MTDLTPPRLTYVRAIPLKHYGDAALLGVDPAQKTIYSEEIYDDDAWMARHVHGYDGTKVDSSDEDHGKTVSPRFIDAPPEAIRSTSGWHTQSLNFHGPRHRGMREDERIIGTVRSISMMAKMRLIEHLGLDVPPPRILGLAESYVMAEIEIVRPRHYIVCRRFRLAYALPQIQHDASGQPYDYDTTIFYLLHAFDNQLMDIETPIETALEGLPGPTLKRPMDCLMADGHIFAVEGGTTGSPATIHLWRIEDD